MGFFNSFDGVLSIVRCVDQLAQSFERPKLDHFFQSEQIERLIVNDKYAALNLVHSLQVLRKTLFKVCCSQNAKNLIYVAF